MGDFNTNVLPSNIRCKFVRDLKSLCNLFSLSQLFHDFTTCRISETCTIIDLILVSDSHKISQSGVIDCCLSDHQIIYCTRKVTKDSVGKQNNAEIRSLKNYSKEAFQQQLLGCDWNPVLLNDDVNQAWNAFKCIFMSAIDNIAPLKLVRIKQRTEPWIYLDVRKCIKDDDSAFLNIRIKS